LVVVIRVCGAPTDENQAMELKDWNDRSFDPSKGPIFVRVDTIEHLFNPLDPQPLNVRDLDVEIGTWITDWADEQKKGAPVEITVVVADDSAHGKEQLVTDGIHNHFAYRRWAAGRQLSRLFKSGRTSLAIGLVVLAGFTTLIRLIESDDNSAFVDLFQEGLTVAGWVAMWRPMEVFLYEWWPIRAELRNFDRLAASVINFVRPGS
jgi:hypothetical protein